MPSTVPSAFPLQPGSLQKHSSAQLQKLSDANTQKGWSPLSLFKLHTRMAKHVCDGLTPTLLWPAVNLSSVKDISKLSFGRFGRSCPPFSAPLTHVWFFTGIDFCEQGNQYRVYIQIESRTWAWWHSTLLNFTTVSLFMKYWWKERQSGQSFQTHQNRGRGAGAIPPTSYTQTLQVCSITAGAGSQPLPSHN